VKLTGTNFSDAIADVTVFVDGSDKCSVLEATATHVRLMLPTSLKKGRHSLDVQIGSERSNKVEVTIRPEEERKDAKDEELQRAEGGPGAAPEEYLSLDVPQWSRERGADLIAVTGKAKYPDGAVILLEMRLDQSLIANTQATVQAGAFRATFGPYDRQLFAGHYKVSAVFQLMRQSGSIRRAFKEFVKDPKKAAEMQQAHDAEFVRVGTLMDEQWQAKELKGYFSQTLARAKDLLRDLENNYGATGRSLFRKGDGTVNEEEWQKWLSKRTLRGVQGEEFQKRVAELKKSSPFLNKDGTFNDAAWREWLDYKWREDGVLRLVKDHVAYRDRYVVVKHQEEMLKLEDIFSGLVRLSQERSEDLYSGNGLPVPASDKQVKSDDLLKIGGSMGPISPTILESHAKKIMKAVGIETPDGAAPGS